MQELQLQAKWQSVQHIAAMSWTNRCKQHTFVLDDEEQASNFHMLVHMYAVYQVQQILALLGHACIPVQFCCLREVSVAV